MNDPDIRRALVAFLSEQHRADHETLIVEELNVCQGSSRMDVVVATTSLHGYEIKSRVDTLSRLEQQLKDYTNVFDLLTIVTGLNHLSGVLANVPDWCGILLANRFEGRVSIESFREPRSNPHRDRLALAQLLWRDEALKVLDTRGKARGVKSKARPAIWKRVSEELSTEEIAREVCCAFRNRTKDWRPNLLSS